MLGSERELADGGFHEGIAQVRVAAGHAAVLVPEKPLEPALRRSGHSRVGREAVPQIVEPEVWDAGALDGPAESAADAMVVLEREQAAVDSGRERP